MGWLVISKSSERSCNSRNDRLNSFNIRSEQNKRIFELSWLSLFFTDDSNVEGYTATTFENFWNWQKKTHHLIEIPQRKGLLQFIFHQWFTPLWGKPRGFSVVIIAAYVGHSKCAAQTGVPQKLFCHFSDPSVLHLILISGAQTQTQAPDQQSGVPWEVV